MRPDKNQYYIGIAEAVAKRSTCLRRQGLRMVNQLTFHILVRCAGE